MFLSWTTYKLNQIYLVVCHGDYSMCYKIVVNKFECSLEKNYLYSGLPEFIKQYLIPGRNTPSCLALRPFEKGQLPNSFSFELVVNFFQIKFHI